MMQHIHNLLHTQGAAIQKISSAQNIKGDSLLYPKSASVEDFTYVDYKKRFSQSISEIPTICTHRVGFGKSWRKHRLMKRDPNKLGTRKSQKDKTPREHRNVAHQIMCPQLNVLLAEWNVPGIWRVQVDPTPLILARMLVASELLYQELKIPVQNR